MILILRFSIPLILKVWSIYLRFELQRWMNTLGKLSWTCSTLTWTRESCKKLLTPLIMAAGPLQLQSRGSKTLKLCESEPSNTKTLSGLATLIFAQSCLIHLRHFLIIWFNSPSPDMSKTICSNGLHTLRVYWRNKTYLTELIISTKIVTLVLTTLTKLLRIVPVS